MTSRSKANADYEDDHENEEQRWKDRLELAE